jgi:hypothetical protein
VLAHVETSAFSEGWLPRISELNGPPLNLEFDEAQSFIKTAQVTTSTYAAIPNLTLAGEPIPQVSIGVRFDKLVDVEPPTHFQAEFTVSLSWYDPRITRTSSETRTRNLLLRRARCLLTRRLRARISPQARANYS